MDTADVKQITMDSSITIKGNQYPINTNADKGLGCYVKILEAIDRNLVAMLSYHSRVLVIQFVTHRYDNDPRNEDMSGLMKVINRRLCSKYKLTRVFGGWVREGGKTGTMHYHVVLFLDGNRVCSHYGFGEMVTEIATFRDFSRPSFNDRSHMVVRGNLESVHEAFFHLSYIAKLRDKKDCPRLTNKFSFSRPHSNPKALVRDTTTKQEAPDFVAVKA